MIQVSTGSKYDLYRSRGGGGNAEKFVNFFRSRQVLCACVRNISRHVPILAKSL